MSEESQKVLHDDLIRHPELNPILDVDRNGAVVCLGWTSPIYTFNKEFLDGLEDGQNDVGAGGQLLREDSGSEVHLLRGSGSAVDGAVSSIQDDQEAGGVPADSVVPWKGNAMRDWFFKHFVCRAFGHVSIEQVKIHKRRVAGMHRAYCKRCHETLWITYPDSP